MPPRGQIFVIGVGMVDAPEPTPFEAAVITGPEMTVIDNALQSGSPAAAGQARDILWGVQPAEPHKDR